MYKQLLTILILSLFCATYGDLSNHGCGTADFYNQKRAFPFFEKSSHLPTFRQLYAEGKILMRGIPGVLATPSDYVDYRLVSLDEFESTLDLFFKTMQEQLGAREKWLESTEHLEKLLNTDNCLFLPYAQKMVVQPGTTCMCKGDLHGDLHSLIACLKQLQEKGYTSTTNPLKLIDPTFRLIFHGDYVDRGLWGVENIYLLMLLKINNPQQVLLIRGNHEDAEIASTYGFSYEFFSKFSTESEERVQRVYEKVSKFYALLPIVLYLGCGKTDDRDFCQCCHGGMEMGYNPKSFLAASDNKQFQEIDMLHRASECAKLPAFSVAVKGGLSGGEQPLSFFCEDFKPLSPTIPWPVGFMWHDFAVDPLAKTSWNAARGFECNKELTQAILQQASTEKNRLSFVVRAHQHVANIDDPMMKLLINSHGCAVLWDNNDQQTIRPGSVYTLLLSPDSLTGTILSSMNAGNAGFDYDTSLAITTGATLSQWRTQVLNNKIYAQK